MTRYYYAQDCPRGCSTAYPGDALCRFETKAARDEWVRSAPVHHIDHMRRVWLDRSDARRWYPAAFSADAAVFPPARHDADYWDNEPDPDGAIWWSGSPTGGPYRDAR